MSEIESTTTPKNMNRRTVVKAAAWAVPVVATAVAVPAFAATNPPQPPAPKWDPVQSGSAGGLSVTNNAISGSERAYYGFTEEVQTGGATIPTLTAVFTVSGAWAPGAVISKSNGGAPLAVGDTLSRGGVTWQVTSVSPGMVTIVSITTTLLESAAEVSTPVIFFNGTGDGSGNQATCTVLLSGAPIGSTGGSHNVQVPVI